MSHLGELEARRRRLMARCDVQRADLAARIAQLEAHPLGRVARALVRPGELGGLALARPLTLVAALAGLFVFGRPRRLLRALRWSRRALLFGSRAALVLRLLEQWRARGASKP